MIFSTGTVGSHEPTTFPSGSTRYFQKFQVGSCPEFPKERGRRSVHRPAGTLSWNFTIGVILAPRLHPDCLNRATESENQLSALFRSSPVYPNVGLRLRETAWEDLTQH